ncbi:HAD family hydrolase [Aestuariibacter halophilus]|uniref:HAD family hydrolase n=1 Tax=Fluctibacter halophilus TaxID=226011 RepID=A0ABS8G3H3_9ALTE|nr:HAD family hydrolase [Aestuariibacter halophilus]MCC2615125.1 HAD family hydrolase [Aestuariibacter halophilus]
MTLSAVVFDLDNSLYPETDYLLGVLRYFGQQYDIDVAPALAAYRPDMRNPGSDILGHLLTLAGCMTPQNHQRLFSLYTSAPLTLALYPQAEPLLKALRSQGVKLGVLTNGIVAVQRNKVASLGLDAWVDGVCYARELGAEKEKPHPEAFSRCCAMLGVPAEQALMVGDDWNNDIQGAQAVGMQTFWLEHDNGRSLAEMKMWLNQHA